MKNKSIKRIALILALIMTVGVLVTACTEGGTEFDSESDVPSSSSSETESIPDEESSSEKAEDTFVSDTETSESAETTAKETEKDTETDKTEEETEDKRFEKEYAPVLYIDPEYIAKVAKNYEWGEKGDMSFSSNMLFGFLSEDKSYVTLIPFDGEQEACFYLFKSYRQAAPIMVVKYRTRSADFYMEFFMNSVDENAQSNSNFAVQNLRTDGEWDIKVVDVKKKLPTQFDGERLAHIRFDFANGSPIPPECEIDIAYIAFFKTVEDAYAFEYGEGYEPPVIGGGDDNIETDDNGYIDPKEIASAIDSNKIKNVDSYLISEDNGYVTLNAKEGSANDAYVNLLSAPMEANEYFAIKYRTRGTGYWVEFFMDSVNDGAVGGSSFSFYPEADGQWKIYVVKVSDKLGSEIFDGKKVNYIRFDFANCNDKLGAWSIDVAGLGFFESEEAALEAFADIGGGSGEVSKLPALLLDAEYIANKISEKATNVESATVSENKDYVTINPTDGIEESYAYMFTTNTGAARYMVIKYRTTTPNFYMQVYLNSNDHSAGNGSISEEGIIVDGSWQTLIYDLNGKLGSDRFNGNSLGHMRIDFINMRGGNKTGADASIDIAYVAFFSSLEAANEYANS